MTEEERAARGWPSTARVPLCRRAAARGATGAVGDFAASRDVEVPTPVSGAHSGSEVVERGATFPGAKAEDYAIEKDQEGEDD